MLRECLERWPKLHDQGIAALYLGIVEGHKGRIEEAKGLLKRAMTLHAEEWLIQEAKCKLEELCGDGTRASTSCRCHWERGFQRFDVRTAGASESPNPF